MRTKIIILIIVIAALVVGIWALAGGNKPTNNTSSGNSTSNSSQSSNSNQASPVATDKVSIINYSFSPADITVKKGTAVTWTNQDSVEHTVTEVDGQNGPSASPLGHGQSYSFTFNQTGTFHYHCSIHPEMTGTVTVTQ